jgi:hypothetical protein
MRLMHGIATRAVVFSCSCRFVTGPSHSRTNTVTAMFTYFAEAGRNWIGPGHVPGWGDTLFWIYLYLLRHEGGQVLTLFVSNLSSVAVHAVLYIEFLASLLHRIDYTPNLVLLWSTEDGDTDAFLYSSSLHFRDKDQAR